MAKAASTGKERANELLLPRERPLHLSKIHASAFGLPLIVMGAGAFLITVDVRDLVLRTVPWQHFQKVESLLNVMQNSIYGYFLIAFGFIAAIHVHFTRKQNVQMVTSKRVVQEAGLWTRELHEIYLSQIKQVKVKQALFDRLAHRGRITIIAKEKKDTIVMPGVGEPKEFKQAIENAILKYGKTAVKQKTKTMG